MEELGMELYRYRALKPGIEDMRLLEVEPSSHLSDTVSCRLRHHKLKDVESVLVEPHVEKKNYETLSYAWGPTYSDGSHLTDMILCNDEPMAVTATLNQALKRYRETMLARQSCKVLWVDAICINQHDLDERSQQVRNMDRIYWYSRHTVIWLGDIDTQDDVDMLETLRCWRASESTSGDEKCLAQTRLTAVKSLLGRPWFNRRWVVQEYALSRRSSFLLSGLEISVTELKQRIASFGESELSPLQGCFPDPRKIEDWDHGVPALYCNSMLWNLHAFDGTKYSNPEDSVYALHAISIDRHLINLDYNKSPKTIFLELAHLYIQTDETHWPLLASAMTRPRNTAYPSWLADWAVPESCACSHGLPRDSPFKASILACETPQVQGSERTYSRLTSCLVIVDNKYLVLHDMCMIGPNKVRDFDNWRVSDSILRPNSSAFCGRLGRSKLNIGYSMYLHWPEQVADRCQIVLGILVKLSAARTDQGEEINILEGIVRLQYNNVLGSFGTPSADTWRDVLPSLTAEARDELAIKPELILE